MISEPVGGYVLAGGRSSRMGQDKSLLRWRGTTLVEHICSEVAAVTAGVTIVGSRNSRRFRCIPDIHSGLGPVGGIATALSDSPYLWNFVIACDMPEICADFLRHLYLNRDGLAVIPQASDGRLHPLCALWHRDALNILQLNAAKGVRRMIDIVASMEYVTVRAGQDRALRNVNTPEDWAMAIASGESE